MDSSQSVGSACMDRLPTWDPRYCLTISTCYGYQLGMKYSSTSPYQQTDGDRKSQASKPARAHGASAGNTQETNTRQITLLSLCCASSVLGMQVTLSEVSPYLRHVRCQTLTSTSAPFVSHCVLACACVVISVVLWGLSLSLCRLA